MSTGQATSNKTTFRRFHDAVNSGDADVVLVLESDVPWIPSRVSPPDFIDITNGLKLR